MTGISQSGLVSVKNRNGATISDKEKVKERWTEHFENVLNRDTVAGKDVDENEKVCDTWDVKEDLFCEEELAKVCDTWDVKEDLFCQEELAKVLKDKKNNKAPGADSVINEFLKYDGAEVRNELLKIMV